MKTPSLPLGDTSRDVDTYLKHAMGFQAVISTVILHGLINEPTVFQTRSIGSLWRVRSPFFRRDLFGCVGFGLSHAEAQIRVDEYKTLIS